MDKINSFVAIDFEWQGHDHDACAVGMVKVIDGVIVSKFYSLIKPMFDDWDIYTVAKHGITKELCENAPTFSELEPFMEEFVGHLTLVGHNYANAEKSVFRNCARTGSPLVDAPYFDTMRGNGRKLEDCCAEYGIPLGVHHDALEDATACAMLYVKLNGAEIKKPTPSDKPKSRMIGPGRDTSLNIAPDLECVEHKDNPFYGKFFVVSGFEASSRDKLIVLLRDKLGGTNRSDISSKVSILISHSSQDGTEFDVGGNKRKKAISLNIPYYNEQWLHDEVIVKYGLEKEWEDVFG